MWDHVLLSTLVKGAHSPPALYCRRRCRHDCLSCCCGPAARLRGIISRLALARRTEGQSTDTERPFEVLEDMGRICAVAVAANEVVMSEVYA
jgi:hypothetical protein